MNRQQNMLLTTGLDSALKVLLNSFEHRKAYLRFEYDFHFHELNHGSAALVFANGEQHMFPPAQ